jgi:putative ABC transport system permease protein
MTVSVAGTSHSPLGSRVAFFDELIDRIEGMPDVESASAINHLPLYGDRWVWPVGVEGKPEPAPGQVPSAVYRVIRPDYFRTMGIALRSGRDFNPGDNLQAPGVVIVNETMAREHWPGGDAIGRRIRLLVAGAGPWLTVAGIARDVRNSDWKEPAVAEMYLPFLQSRDFMSNPAPYFSYMTIVARTKEDPGALAGAIRNVVWQIESNAPVSDAMTLEQVRFRLLSYSTVPALLLGFFATVALILAMGGVYGVMSYAVTVRTPEFGIRIALGAHPQSILQLTLRDGFKLAGAGAAAGLIAARFLTGIISNLLFGVETGDAITFLAVAFLLVLVSLTACLMPALRAARVDPIESLRLL